MPTRPGWPAPGTPMRRSGPASIREILGPLIDTAGFQASAEGPVSAIGGRGGQHISVDDGFNFALFEITTGFSTDSLPSGEGSPNWPASGYAWAKGKLVYWFGQTNQKWSTATDEYDPTNQYLWHPTGLLPTSTADADAATSGEEDGGEGDQSNAARVTQDEMVDGKFFMPTVCEGDWVWCIQEPSSGFWVVLAPYETIVRFKLTESLTSGGTATANVRLWDNDTSALKDGPTITVQANKDTPITMSSGSFGNAKFFADSQMWEIIQILSTGIVPAVLTADLLPGDSQAFVSLEPVGTQIPVDNLFAGCAGVSGQYCLLLATDSSWQTWSSNTQSGSPALQYSIIWVRKTVVTQLVSGAYDAGLAELTVQGRQYLVDALPGDSTSPTLLFQGLTADSEETGVAATATLEADETSPTYGDTVTFTATVSGTGGTPSGSVAFVDGSTILGTATLAGGTATWSTITLPAGDHGIVVQYLGDSFFSSATSSSVSVTVAKADVTLTLAITQPSGTNYSLGIVLNATIAGSESTDASVAPTGAVRIYDATSDNEDDEDDEPVLLYVKQLGINGILNYFFIPPAAGTRTMGVSYDGDANYNAADLVTQSVTITKQPITVVANDIWLASGSAVPTFTAQFQTLGGQNDITGTPAFSCDVPHDTPHGTYPITPSLGTLHSDNYDFAVFSPGTLTSYLV